MPSLIVQILEYLNSNFEDDWLTNYFDKDENISEENQLDIISKIDGLLNITIETFYKSLISGEYIIDTKKIIDEITTLKDQSDILLNPTTVDNPSSQKFLLEAIKKGYIDILQIFSNLYLNFIKLVQSQIENPNIDIVYEASFDTLRFFSQVSNDDIKDKIKFFDSIIFVYRIDHFFNDNISTYGAINQLENSIKEHQASEYFIAIKEKLNFLKFKWEIRQKSYKKNNFKLSKAYIIDDELFISTDDVKYNPTLNKLQNWKEHIECYYELDNWESRINNISIKFKHEDYNNLKLLELIVLLKYYKDVNPNYKNLKAITKQFKKRYKENCNSEQRFLYNKTYLYALNNQFSSLLEQSNVEEAQVQNLKNRIQKIQNKCNIDNFFLESKYINYKLNQLSYIFNNRQELEDITVYKEEIDRLTQDVKLYKEKLNWSKNNLNLLFQLPYNECLINSNINDLDIFYASSVVLPLPHEESQNNFDQIETKLKELKQLVFSVASLNKEFSTIKQLKLNQEKAIEELKNNQIKSIETISLFTAIIAFIITSIPSFSFVKDIHQALLFTGIIGSCLLIMLGVMFLFTRGFKKGQSWILIIISILIFLFALYSLSKSVNKLEVDVKRDYNAKLDSINKIERSRMDSIIKSTSIKENPTSK